MAIADFNQTVWLVIGACSEVGFNLCLKLVLEGCRVIAVGTHASLLQQLQREVDDVRGELRIATVAPAALPEWIMQLSTEHPPITGIIRCPGNYGVLPLQTSYPLAERCAATAPAIASSSIVEAIQTADFAALNVVVDLLSVDRVESDADGFFLHSLIAESSVKRFFEFHYLRLVVDGANDDSDGCARRQWSDRLSPQVPVDWIARILRHALLSARPITDVVLKLTHEQGIAHVYPTAETESLGEPLSVQMVHGQLGRAVVATKAFAPGERVFRTTGTVLHHQTEHSLQIERDRHLEPDPPVRLINHSCDPNLGVKTNADGLPDFYAFRAIQPGDELTFDYAMTELTHVPRTNTALEFDLSCRCGSPHCRGKLGYYSELPAALKQRYQGFVSRYLVLLEQESSASVRQV